MKKKHVVSKLHLTYFYNFFIWKKWRQCHSSNKPWNYYSS